MPFLFEIGSTKLAEVIEWGTDLTIVCTDIGCEPLSGGCPLLHAFKCADTKVTDRGWFGLGCNAPETLEDTTHMFQCAVTDEGMRSFSRCAAQSSGVAPCEERNYRQWCTKSRRAASSLCRLYIGHCTGVTNGGAFALAEAMPDLTVFDVASTSASDNGKCQLKLLLPDCNL